MEPFKNELFCPTIGCMRLRDHKGEHGCPELRSPARRFVDEIHARNLRLAQQTDPDWTDKW